MKYSKLLISLFLAQGVVLTGCGGGGSSSGGGTSSSSSSSISSSSSSSSSSSVPGAPWNLVWQDEFEGTAIDTTKWEHEIDCGGGGNNEWQCYTADPENSYVEDGMLHIAVQHVGGTGDDAYTSARLRTLAKGDWKYGRIEVNAKIPEGQGLWPAIWMLPSERVYGDWPLSGEIDIFEAVNPNGTGNNNVYGTLHYGQSWPNNLHTGAPFVPETNIWEEFHTYAIEWEEGEIRWYVDDAHFATQTSDGWYTYYDGEQEVGFQLGEGAAPFNQTFHLLLNVAVGGEWPFGEAGNEEVTLNLPQEMVVDYVRVYECSANAETGIGCASDVDPEVEPLEGFPGQQNVYYLYQDGPSTLTFDVLGGTVDNTLVPGLWPETGGVVVSTPEYAGDDGTVWDIEFNGLGNVQLLSSDMSEQAAVNDGFLLQSMETTGEVKFDLFVESIDPETELLVKLDSGHPAVSSHSIDIPPVGEWTTVAVSFSEMTGSAVHANIVSPFVLESTGIAHVRLNNIRISCLAECAVEPQRAGIFDVFTDSFNVYVNGQLDPNWADHGIDTYDGPGQSIVSSAVEDPDKGTVQEIYFQQGPGVWYIQTKILRDMTAFADGGYLTFEIKPLTGSGEFFVKVDCVHPCTSGDVPVEGTLPLNTWSTVEVPISNFTAGGLQLSRVNTPFIILPQNEAAASFRVTNIRWVYTGEGDGGGDGGGASGNPIIDSNFFIFEDAVDANWSSPGVFFYNAPNAGTITWSVTADSENAENEVLQFEFGADGDHNSTMYIQSSTPKDLQAFAGGNLKFDLKVIDAASNIGGFLVKADCVYPCGSAVIPVPMPATIGAWTPVTVPIDNLTGLTLGKVDTPISFYPVQGEQEGVTFQLDNIRWELAE